MSNNYATFSVTNGVLYIVVIECIGTGSSSPDPTFTITGGSVLMSSGRLFSWTVSNTYGTSFFIRAVRATSTSLKVAVSNASLKRQPYCYLVYIP